MIFNPFLEGIGIRVMKVLEPLPENQKQDQHTERAATKDNYLFIGLHVQYLL